MRSDVRPRQDRSKVPRPATGPLLLFRDARTMKGEQGGERHTLLGARMGNRVDPSKLTVLRPRDDLFSVFTLIQHEPGEGSDVHAIHCGWTTLAFRIAIKPDGAQDPICTVPLDVANKRALWKFNTRLPRKLVLLRQPLIDLISDVNRLAEVRAGELVFKEEDKRRPEALRI